MTAVTVEAGNAAKVTALADLRAELVGVKAYLQRFCTGAFLLYLHAYAVEDTAARLGSSPLVGVETAYLIAIAVPSRPTPPDTTAYLRACGSRLAYSASAGVSRGTAAARSPMVSAESYVPSYRLSREVYTIPDLWREWTVGLVVGLPSIDQLDCCWTSRWGSPEERQYYSIPKVIIDEVHRRAAIYGEA